MSVKKERTTNPAEGELQQLSELFNASVGSGDLGLQIELIRPATGVGAPALPTPGAEGPVEVLEAASARLAEAAPTVAGRPS